MKKNSIFCLSIIFCSLPVLGTPHWIIAFIYPKCSSNESSSQICSLEQIISHNHYAGLYATYAGYVTISDHTGQIRFPVKHEGETFSVLVTQKITPVFSEKKTINHFEVDPISTSALYTLTQEKAKNSDELVWNTKIIPLPDTRIISPFTLILFGKPQDISIQLGTTPYMKSSQLILPKIAISDTIKNEFNIAEVLTIRQFFAPLRAIYKQGDQALSTQLAY